MEKHDFAGTQYIKESHVACWSKRVDGTGGLSKVRKIP
jgi:hypothetical protein